MKIEIDRRKRTRDKGRCSNIKCRAILEPPYNVLTFELDCEPGHKFRRFFCVDCTEKIQRCGYRSVTFVLRERGSETV